MSPLMEDSDRTTGPDALLGAFEACLARQGRDGWAEAFADLAALTGAAQVMIFAYAPDRCVCLLSRNFHAAGLGASLAAEYLDGWFRADPLYEQVLAMPPGELRQIDSAEIADAMSAEYRGWFYDRPGLGGKAALLVTGDTLRLAVNLYWPGAGAPPVCTRLPAVAGWLALRHFQMHPAYEYPAPLAVLSPRERAVCQGILAGNTADTLADALGIAASSVVTYRARAYEKLGITSRGALFALCAG